MLLQRLVSDQKSGFNYDHMGSAEFEFGSARNARIALAQLAIDKQLRGQQIRLWEKWGISSFGPVDAVAFSTQTFLDSLKNPHLSDKVIPDFYATPSQESMRIDDSQYIGWMRVDPYNEGHPPLLIVRNSPDYLAAGSKYLHIFVEQMLNAAAA